MAAGKWWDRVRRWWGGAPASPQTLKDDRASALRWYEPEDNPFGLRVLDVRSVTWTLMATTGDPQVAESFAAQRSTDGRALAATEIEEATRVPCDLVLPHNGALLEGVVFKSQTMEERWDIYIYDSVFLFARSWTGELRYRAFAEVGATAIRIHQIEATHEQAETAPQAVYFLLGTHAMRQVLPHTLPRDVPADPQQIAHWTFSTYGKHGCYATYEDITTVEIAPPTSPS